MTRPHERWPRLWTFFMLLHQDWDYDYADEEAAMAADLPGWNRAVLHEALAQWHEAFDTADDAELERLVNALNPSYAPERTFGGYRGWAEWIREHLEKELAERAAGRRSEPPPPPPRPQIDDHAPEEFTLKPTDG